MLLLCDGTDAQHDFRLLLLLLFPPRRDFKGENIELELILLRPTLGPPGPRDVRTPPPFLDCLRSENDFLIVE